MHLCSYCIQLIIVLLLFNRIFQLILVNSVSGVIFSFPTFVKGTWSSLLLFRCQAIAWRNKRMCRVICMLKNRVKKWWFGVDSSLCSRRRDWDAWDKKKKKWSHFNCFVHCSTVNVSLHSTYDNDMKIGLPLSVQCVFKQIDERNTRTVSSFLVFILPAFSSHASFFDVILVNGINLLWSSIFHAWAGEWSKHISQSYDEWRRIKFFFIFFFSNAITIRFSILFKPF